jgi:hypothetical protein
VRVFLIVAARIGSGTFCVLRRKSMRVNVWDKISLLARPLTAEPFQNPFTYTIIKQSRDLA